MTSQQSMSVNVGLCKHTFFITMNRHSSLPDHLSPTSWAWTRFAPCSPRLGFAIAWGYHSFRQLRRLVECIRPTYLQQRHSFVATTVEATATALKKNFGHRFLSK